MNLSRNDEHPQLSLPFWCLSTLTIIKNEGSTLSGPSFKSHDLRYPDENINYTSTIANYY